MAEAEYIVQIDRPHKSLDYQWSLPQKPKPKPYALSSYEHNVMAGDDYVALYLVGGLTKWRQNKEKHRSIEEDALAEWHGKTIYIENDRGTEHEGDIASKAARYAKKDGWFHVLFVAPRVSRAEQILDELPRDAGTRFIVTLQDYVQEITVRGGADVKGFISANRPTELQFLHEILSVQWNVQSGILELPTE